MYRNMLRKQKLTNLVQLLVFVFLLFWFLIIHKDFLQIFQELLMKRLYLKKSANKF